MMENFCLDHLSMDRSLSSLSGGEKQRIKLAKTFLNYHLRGVFFIENLSFGLSEKELLHLGKFLKQSSQGKCTIFVIDPHPEIASLADHVLNIERSGGEKKRVKIFYD